MNLDVDYIGTRLHAGIFALQKKKRSIILSVDERARDIDSTFNLKCINRDRIEERLEDRINTTFETNLNIDFSKIEIWEDQFR